MQRLSVCLLALALGAAPARAGRRDPGGKAAARGQQPASAPVALTPVLAGYRVDGFGGQLTPRRVLAALQLKRPTLRACVSRSRNRKVAGQLVLRLRARAGAPRVTVQQQRRSTLNNAKVAGCLRRTVSRLQLTGPGWAVITLEVGRGGPRTGLASGAGGLGLRGTGQGGGGTGSGTLGGIQGAPIIKKRPVIIGEGGPLPREVIRRVIRTHQPEVRHCYEQQLTKQPSLAGRVVVKFTIQADGRVSAARVITDTLKTPAVANCLVRRVLTWRFPAPLGGGIVKVSYPFVFRTAP